MHRFLLEGIRAAQVLMLGGRFRDVVVGIGAYFQLIEVMPEDIGHHSVGRFVCAKRPNTSAFEAFVRVFVGQA